MIEFEKDSKMKYFNKANKFICLMILTLTSGILSGCEAFRDRILQQGKVIFYVEPNENTPRAKVMLATYEKPSWWYDPFEFYIIRYIDDINSYYTYKVEYLYNSNRYTMNPTKVKNLGIDVQIEGKNKLTEVYLPAETDAKITLGYRNKKCDEEIHVAFNRHKQYILSADQDGSRGCGFKLHLYEIITDDNYNNSLKLLE